MNRRQLLKNSLFAGLAVAIGFKAKSAAAQPVGYSVYEDIAIGVYNPMVKVWPGEVHILRGKTGSGKSSALSMIAEAHLAADPKNTVWILDTEGYPWQGWKYPNRMTALYLTTETMKTTCNDLIEKIQSEPNSLIIMDMVELLMDGKDRMTRTLMASRFAKAFSRYTGHPVIRTVQTPLRIESNLMPEAPKIFADSISELGDRYANRDLGIHVGAVYRTPEIDSPAWKTYRLIQGINPTGFNPIHFTGSIAPNQDA